MTMNQFLIAFAINVLSQAIPMSVAIYLAIRLAISHGELSIIKRRSRNE